VDEEWCTANPARRNAVYRIPSVLPEIGSGGDAQETERPSSASGGRGLRRTALIFIPEGA